MTTKQPYARKLRNGPWLLDVSIFFVDDGGRLFMVEKDEVHHQPRYPAVTICKGRYYHPGGG